MSHAQRKARVADRARATPTTYINNSILMQSNKKEINEFLGKNHLELFQKKEHVTKQGTKSSEKNLF